MTLNAVIALILRFFYQMRQIFRPIISHWLTIDLYAAIKQLQTGKRDGSLGLVSDHFYRAACNADAV